MTSFIFRLKVVSGTPQANCSDSDQWNSNDQANEQINDDCVIPRTGVEENVRKRSQDRED